MKIVRRAFSYILIAAMLLPVLSGCHGSRGLNAFVMPETFDETAQHEITFWAKNDTNKTQTAIYEKAILDFEALYPNIRINLRLYTDYGRIYNDVITNISTNTTPNVCITYPDHIATYLTGASTVVPLDDLFADEKYGLGGNELKYDSPGEAEIIPQFLSECAFNGHYYAIPFMRSTEACYVNKTYVEALGFTLPDMLTWDFVWEVAQAATAKNADGTFALNGKNVLIPIIYKSTDNMMIQLLRQCGGDYSTEDGDILLFNDRTRDLLYTVAEQARSGAFSTFKISGYPANFLDAGQCVFAIDSTAGATWMGTDAPLSDISPDSIVDFETEVMCVPQFDVQNPKMISQGPSVCIFNKDDPQEVLASWLFAQYLLTNEVQIAYSETEGYVPVTEKAQTSPEYLDYLSRCGEDSERYYEVKIKAVKMLLANTANTFTTPVFNGSASLRDASGQLIESVTKSVKRHETIDDEYFDRLFEDVSSLYRLDQISAGGGSASSEKAQLGPLPKTSVILLAALAAAWSAIIAYVIFIKLRAKK